MTVSGMTLLLNQGVSALPSNDQQELTSSIAKPFMGWELELPVSHAKTSALESNSENIEIADFMTQYVDELLTVFESLKSNSSTQVNQMPSWTILGEGISKKVFVHDLFPMLVFKIEYSKHRNNGILRSMKTAQALNKYKEQYQLDLLKIPKSILITEIKGKQVTIQVEERIELDIIGNFLDALILSTDKSYSDIKLKLATFGLCDLHHSNLVKVKGENSIAIVDLDCDIYTDLKEIDRDFIIAVSLNNYDQIKISLMRGADSNTKDKSGKTALIMASGTGKLEQAQLFLENGADINTKDESGRTALMVAASAGNLEIVQLFLKIGADIAVRDVNGAYYLAKAMVQTLFFGN